MGDDDFQRFSEQYNAGKSQIVWRRIVADLETPIGTYLKLAEGRKNTFLLESVQDAAVRGRYSIIGTQPDVILKVEAGAATINRRAQLDDTSFEPVDALPLDALRELVAGSQIDMPKGLPPQSAGVYGYLGYEMVRYMEVLPDSNPDHLQTPEAVLMRPSLLAIFDTLKDELYLTAPVYVRDGVSARQAHEAAQARIDDAIARLGRAMPATPALPDLESIAVTSNTSRDEYFAMVARAKEYITAGDIFQVVLSQRFSADFNLPPTALYRALRRTNPSPYMYFLDFGDFAVAGSSPEILVRVQDGEVTIRPIAGTRKRGATPSKDAEMAAELMSDPKELAEHLMLLDLGRNDVGRVAKIGTVKVTDKFFLEYYSHVMHIVSNVVGELDPQYDFVDALSAGFPAGTVSGAPKVRAMEIIDELEKSRRGIYGGCVGYFGADGTMDTCIVLRTAILKEGKLHVQSGAGIVADSQPALEQMECENKARALFSAAEEALRYAGEARIGQ
ncbi:anthranilate synthase component I [Devosia neptuniae]|jgi:anthranilate synthase component 1|uniref:anthranilate synthase component I n=1 Tax=Devosia TaxID=46913 RepID=UPI0022AF1499|nr:anthranilate synthase component I [Devosia neptuniae]MCZ4345027.1 anthranilate synthase component I [Devosia neptuniae]|tara:strand:- start:2732 stop:4240 length:1509 start_codon:yes stop_codon:yes gene_type:complete